MQIEHLREKIEQSLNTPDNLNLNERVILSTLLHNNIFETAFKLRLSINQVETTLKQFTTKLKGART